LATLIADVSLGDRRAELLAQIYGFQFPAFLLLFLPFALPGLRILPGSWLKMRCLEITRATGVLPTPKQKLSLCPASVKNTPE
jgi:hypothetical protein